MDKRGETRAARGPLGFVFKISKQAEPGRGQRTVVGFRFWPSVKRDYADQGAIFFACRRYAKLSRREQQRIDELIDQAGGEYADALREYLLTTAGWQVVCRRWYVSENTLRRCVRRFYEMW